MTASSGDDVAAPLTRGRWADAGAGERYAGSRWRSDTRRRRDPRRIARMLARHLPAGAERVLDAPCGTGRLFEALEADGRLTVGLDVSTSMLSEASTRGVALVRGAVEALPFRDGSFDAVVCCRLLHHLDDRAFERSVGELVRVSAHLVVATFWDAGTLPAWSRRLRAAPPRRIERPRAELNAAFARAGADVVALESVFPLFTRQCYAAALKRGAPHRG